MADATDALADAVGGDLVIGLGNPLRSDDGVGWWLARRAESRTPESNRARTQSAGTHSMGTHSMGTQSSTPRVLVVQQLTPELSLELAAARRVLFLDAWLVAATGSAEGLMAPERASGPSAASLGASSWAPGADPEAPRTSARRDLADEPAAAPHAPCLRRLPRPTPGSGDPAGSHDPAGGGDQVGAFSHGLRPSQLLAITAWLHGRMPEAWMLLVPAFDVAHGTALSPRLRRLLPRAEELLRQWCSAREPHAVLVAPGDA